MKYCILCGVGMEPVFDSWENLQPYGGGEVCFIFSFGSNEFDLEFGNTMFRGIICDKCAATCIKKMERKIL